MKHYSGTIFWGIALYSCLGFAQVNSTSITEDFKPSTVNQPGQEYPQVNSQGYARFKITAPEAKSVVVSLGLGGAKGGTALVKGEDGLWKGTTAGAMDEGFHYYHVTIDGGVLTILGHSPFMVLRDGKVVLK